jgi:hypothetical protein
MPAQIQFYTQDSVVAPGSPPTLGTSFATADVHVHDLSSLFTNPDAPFRAWIDSIHVRLTGIAGGATTCTIRACLDAAGDYTVMPDVTATIVPGVTTTDSGCIAVSVGIPMFGALLSTTSLYLFAKLDAGTATWQASCVTLHS